MFLVFLVRGPLRADLARIRHRYPAKQILLEHAMLQMDLAKEYENAESGIVDDVDGVSSC